MLLRCRSQPIFRITRPKVALKGRRMHVYSLKMRWGTGDNYCYVVKDDETSEATIVDPAAPDDVLQNLKSLERQGLKLISITNTHHHWDHSGGNPVFKSLYPSLPLYAGKDSPLVTRVIGDGEKVLIGKNIEMTAVHTPCHTQDSICWHAHDVKTGEDAIFSGDTLFNCGCGRFFEGNANEMLAAMNKLAKLPHTTKVYPGHEYTKSNIKFARKVDPNNKDLQKLETYCNNNEVITGIYTIADELSYNPFMRTDSPVIQQKLGTTSEEATMAKLRQAKDKGYL